MDYEMKPYIVYVKPDEQNRIIAVNSSAFLTDTTGWVEIDSGYGDKYHHAQGNYLEKALYDDRGIHQYKLKSGKPVARTAKEMNADYVPPVETPDPLERIAALEEQLAAAKILLGVE